MKKQHIEEANRSLSNEPIFEKSKQNSLAINKLNNLTNKLRHNTSSNKISCKSPYHSPRKLNELVYKIDLIKSGKNYVVYDE